MELWLIIRPYGSQSYAKVVDMNWNGSEIRDMMCMIYI